MQELLDLCLKKIADLERKIEKYYQLLNVDNELDFILKGTYITDDELEVVLTGNY